MPAAGQKNPAAGRHASYRPFVQKSCSLAELAHISHPDATADRLQCAQAWKPRFRDAAVADRQHFTEAGRKRPRRDDGNRLELLRAKSGLHRQYQAVRLPSHGRPQHEAIIRVAARFRRYVKSAQPVRHAPVENLRFLGLGCGHLEFARQMPTDFSEDRVRKDQLVAIQAHGHDCFAQSARGKSRENDIRVEHDFHEIALKTSSSVRKPWASAKAGVCPSQRGKSLRGHVLS